tara:strand:+ start:1281 stop:1511 length:231 start_codon:yes stop_codon:yes gene_type:complete
MSKTSELDLIAQGVADHIKEIIYHTVEWQIADQPFDGDEFNAIHSDVMKRAIEYLYDEVSNPLEKLPGFMGTEKGR